MRLPHSIQFYYLEEKKRLLVLLMLKRITDQDQRELIKSENFSVYQNTLIILVLRIKFQSKFQTLMSNRLLLKESLRKLKVRNIIKLQELLDYYLIKDLEERELRLLKKLLLLREIKHFQLAIENPKMIRKIKNLRIRKLKTNSNIEFINFLILRLKLKSCYNL